MKTIAVGPSNALSLLGAGVAAVANPRIALWQRSRGECLLSLSRGQPSDFTSREDALGGCIGAKQGNPSVQFLEISCVGWSKDTGRKREVHKPRPRAGGESLLI